MWNDLGKQGIHDKDAFVDNTVRKAVYYCRRQILHKNPKAYNVPINHNFILSVPIKVSKKNGANIDVILAIFTPLQRLIFVLHTAAGYAAKDISCTTDIDIKTINMAIDTESANIEKILKARGNGDSVSASEIITTFTEKAENIPVPDAVDDRIMEIIERIAAPIEKKKRNQKTAKRITTLLIACFLIWAVSNAVSAVTSEEINSKATNTATEAAFESAATAATTEPTNTNANE